MPAPMPTLVLDRKVDQGVTSICECGCVTRVEVRKLDGRHVKLAFRAPESVVIWRDELYARQVGGRADDGREATP